MVQFFFVYLCHETVKLCYQYFFRLCDALLLCDALILCDPLILCDALFLYDALISDFNSVKFICITTAASFLSRFELITISLLALHSEDFISTCMNNFNNDHRLILNFILHFFYPYYTYFYIFLYETIYYVFHGRVTLFFANNSSTQYRITMKFLHNFFLTMK